MFRASDIAEILDNVPDTMFFFLTVTDILDVGSELQNEVKVTFFSWDVTRPRSPDGV